MEADRALNQVRRFVAGEIGVPESRLQSDTTLFGDLGVDGADGCELIVNLAREFGVDVASFDPSKHFGPEAGASPISLFVQVCRYLAAPSASPEVRQGLVPITLGDLVSAVQAGRWPDPPRASTTADGGPSKELRAAEQGDEADER